uniref:Uncharacterized protein n=1 Tax=Nelumbo nucifera TaxID=4432 RepID=A0A822XV58_NELNU|nr:TPA_asm: hypothetical protein HUJ06_022791 [Nelumbo nucifera]
MFAIHGGLREIVFYVTHADAKCLSVEDRGSMQKVSVGNNGKGKGKFEYGDDCCLIDSCSDDGAHGDEYGEECDQGDNEGFESECDDMDAKEDVPDDDGEGVQGVGVQCDTSMDGEGNRGGNGVTTNLSDYGPASEYDSLCDNKSSFRRGKDRTQGLHEFDFSNPKFLVGMAFANVKEFREILRHYYVVEGIGI